MGDNRKMKYTKSDITAILLAPEMDIDKAENAGDILLSFYRALGWNGKDLLDPRRIRTTKAVYMGIFSAMKEKYPDPAVAMVNWGPGVDAEIPPEKVYLLKGWTEPAALTNGAAVNTSGKWGGGNV
jgi:hypothetical protein